MVVNGFSWPYKMLGWWQKTFCNHPHWRIQGALGMRTPWSNFFHFHVFFKKKKHNNRFLSLLQAQDWRPPPSLWNPVSATGPSVSLDGHWRFCGHHPTIYCKYLHCVQIVALGLFHPFYVLTDREWGQRGRSHANSQLILKYAHMLDVLIHHIVNKESFDDTLSILEIWNWRIEKLKNWE